MGSSGPLETWRPFADQELAGAAASFDAAALVFARRWARENGHQLFKRAADVTQMMPGRGIALVVEGTPLVGGDTPGEWFGFPTTSGSRGCGPAPTVTRVASY